MTDKKVGEQEKQEGNKCTRATVIDFQTIIQMINPS